ncbi:MAG TPA: hypothetical protein VNF07_12215 [Acidimicrobiales bacterium]|nr:hypothetical protein [Acidimicrobiales bacterium]
MDDEDFPGAAFFLRLGRRMATDPELAVCGRFLDLAVGFESDGNRQVITFHEGQLVGVAPDREDGVDLAFSGSHEDWERFLSREPPPGYADVVGMDRRGDTFSITGDATVLARHLRALSCVLRLARAEATAGAP